MANNQMITIEECDASVEKILRCTMPQQVMIGKLEDALVRLKTWYGMVPYAVAQNLELVIEALKEQQNGQR